MARINIEEPFWDDITDVAVKIGDRDRAIGNAVRWFLFAQQKYKSGKTISEQEFKEKGFLEELIPIFAERVNGEIRCNGAEKHFDWLRSKVDSGRKGGQISAQRPRDSKGRLLKSQAQSKQGLSDSKQTLNESKDNQASFSYSLSCSNSRDNINNENFTFESLWQAYPKKVSKREGFKRLKDQLKDLPRIEKAVGNYVRYLNLPWVDRFPKDFATFIGTKSSEVKVWHDWEDPDPSVFQPPKNWQTKLGQAPPLNPKFNLRAIAQKFEDELKTSRDPEYLRRVLDEQQFAMLEQIGIDEVYQLCFSGTDQTGILMKKIQAIVVQPGGNL